MMMLDEVENLLGCVENPEFSSDEYLTAIIEDNCIYKHSVKIRKITAMHLCVWAPATEQIEVLLLGLAPKDWRFKR